MNSRIETITRDEINERLMSREADQDPKIIVAVPSATGRHAGHSHPVGRTVAVVAVAGVTWAAGAAVLTAQLISAIR